MEKRYQIFISSTYRDLKKARMLVRDTILSLYQFPVGMEMFGAGDEEQWNYIKRDIDSSDYYVLIIGNWFGSEVPGENISYTQKEFRYAVSQKIPVLAFLINENAKAAPPFRETDPRRITLLEEFRKEVETGRTCAYWNKVEEIGSLVAVALLHQIARKPQRGWVRGEIAEQVSEKPNMITALPEDSSTA